MSLDYTPPAERHHCNKCGRPFDTRDDLIAHVRAMHKWRNLSPRLRPHYRGPIACGHPGCDYSFATHSSADQHRYAKHGSE